MRAVVGVALCDRGRLLAARRRGGGWEFPGGKVEPGERQRAAAVRECAEELGIRVGVSRRLPGAQPCGRSYTLYVWVGTILAGRPRPLEHAELRWVTAAELPDLGWLPADVPFLPAVAAHLGR